MLTRPGGWHSLRGNLAFLERFPVLCAHDEIAAPLSPQGRGEDHAGIVFELLAP
jgi:hypothetical protein